MTTRLRRSFPHLLVYIVLTGTGLAMLIPVAWTLSTSLKPFKELFGPPPHWIPWQVTSEAYRAVLTETATPRYMFNSLVVALATVLITVVFGGLAGYAFSRSRFRFKNILLYIVLATMMIPGLTNLVPLYVLMNRFRLLDTYLVMILIYSARCLPFSIWILKSFFDSIPKDLEDSAVVDGCTPLSAFFQVIAPISSPGLAAVAIFNFLFSWNEFIVAVIFTSSKSVQTFPIGLYHFMHMFIIEYGKLTAAALLGAMPAILLFLLFRDRFVHGMTEGAMKA